MSQHPTRLFRHYLLFAIICLVVVFLISCTLGRFPISLQDILKMLLHQIFPQKQTWQDTAAIALFNIRLPRLILALFVGIGLSLAGATFQALFQNPMVSPDLLGAASGAGLGAALAILLGVSSFFITLFAFGFGLVSIFLVLFIAHHAKQNRVLSLILTGIIVSALFSALLSFIKLVADPTNQLPAITYWLMGSLNTLYDAKMWVALPIICLASCIIFCFRWQLNVLSLGDETAKTLGLPAEKLRTILLLAATLNTAACVSVSGMIGWVGLIIPHFARLLVGGNHRHVIPMTALLGAIFLIVTDDMARLIHSSEIPIGILTAFVGAPFFLHLILRRRNG